MNRFQIRIHRRTLTLAAAGLAAVIGVGAVATPAVAGLHDFGTLISKIAPASTNPDAELERMIERAERDRQIIGDYLREQAAAEAEVVVDPAVHVPAPVESAPEPEPEPEPAPEVAPAPAPKPAPAPAPAPKPAPAPPAVTPTAEATMYVTADSLNIRAHGTKDSARVGSLRYGSQVTVNGDANGFKRLSDGRGFVSASFLSATAPEPRPAWSTHVSNRGGQETIDLCAGGLTDWTEWQRMGYAGTWYGLHNNCGGFPVLDLKHGDLVKIGGDSYRVIGDGTLPYPGYTLPNGRNWNHIGDVYREVTAMGGDIYIQTCHRQKHDGMRVVVLSKI